MVDIVETKLNEKVTDIECNNINLTSKFDNNNDNEFVNE